MNGYENYETWNVAMWISNSEFLNRIMTLNAKGDYEQFLRIANYWGNEKTPDGVWKIDMRRIKMKKSYAISLRGMEDADLEINASFLMVMEGLINNSKVNNS